MLLQSCCSTVVVVVAAIVAAIVAVVAVVAVVVAAVVATAYGVVIMMERGSPTCSQCMQSVPAVERLTANTDKIHGCCCFCCCCCALLPLLLFLLLFAANLPVMLFVLSCLLLVAGVGLFTIPIHTRATSATCSKALLVLQ